MTDMIRRIKAKERMDANNCWWVSELLAADCNNKTMATPRVEGRNATVVHLVA